MIAIGFIGAGKMATTLASKLARIDRANVVAVCDLDEDVAGQLAEPWGAAVYADHLQMYAAEDLDAVVVAIPPFALDDQVRTAAERGIDVFVEKPVALHPEKARENETIVEEAGIVTGTGYVFRYDEITDRATELLDGRPIGMIDAHYWGGLPASAWGCEFEKSGGQILTRSTHAFDLVRFFGGDVAQVSATGTTRIGIEAVDFEDAVTTTMRHENSVASCVSSTITSPTKRADVNLHGRDFHLELDYSNQRITGVIDDESIAFEQKTDRYGREMEYFVAAVAARDRSRVRSDYADGARTVELNWAVIDSAREGRPVSVR